MYSLAGAEGKHRTERTPSSTLECLGAATGATREASKKCGPMFHPIANDNRCVHNIYITFSAQPIPSSANRDARAPSIISVGIRVYSAYSDPDIHDTRHRSESTQQTSCFLMSTALHLYQSMYNMRAMCARKTDRRA